MQLVYVKEKKRNVMNKCKQMKERELQLWIGYH